MIPIIVIAAATALVGGGLLIAFWNDLTEFLKKAAEKVKALVHGVLFGVKVLLKRIENGFQQIARHYSKVDNHWEETIVTKTVSESEVPADIRARVKSDVPLDLSDELEMALTTS